MIEAYRDGAAHFRVLIQIKGCPSRVNRVTMVGFGTGANSGEWLPGSDVPFLLAAAHFSNSSATVARPAHHLVVEAERIHNIEGKQGNVWGLEHIAAGLKYEVRRLHGRGNRRRFLTQSLEHFRIELQALKHRHSATTVAISLHALSASFGKLIVRLRDAKPRHGKQEARIDAVVARLDALPALHAGPDRCRYVPFEDAAGSTLGQTSTHLPHRVQASSIASTRSPRTVSNGTSFIGCITSSAPADRSARVAHDNFGT
jgi:hypothetical protein